MKLGIWLPTYHRPEKLAQVAKNIEENTHYPYKLYFGVEEADRDSILAAKDTGHEVIVNEYEPGYSNTIQTIYERTDDEYFFHANDDFVFLKDWDKAPIDMLEEDKRLMVIGCHDGNPATNFWTISMVRRKYIEDMSGVIDMPDRVFYPYNHNFIDTEFTSTAVHRGVWDGCPNPCIEHHHYTLGHLYNEEIPHDDTYKKNDKLAGADSETFNSRKHLWS